MLYTSILATLATLLASTGAQIASSSEALSNQMGLTALSGLHSSGAMTMMATGTGAMATGAMATGAMASSATPTTSPSSGAGAPTNVPGYGVGAAVGALGLMMAL